MDTITYLETVTKYWPIAAITVAALVATAGLIYTVVQFLNRQKLKSRAMVWLELTPPASVAKTPEASVQLFSVIHGMRASRKLKDKFLNRAPVMSLEIVSTKQDGIRYLIQIEASRSQSLEKAISSYIPDVKVSVADAPRITSHSVMEFKQRGHYVLPLTSTEIFEQHDPLGYITGAMTKLDDDEQITLQLVVTPVRLREAQQLSRRIMANEDILRRVQQTGGNFSLTPKIFEGMSSFAMGFLDLIGEMHSGTTQSYNKTKQGSKNAQFQQQVNTRQRPARTLSAFELELMESMHKKVTQPLFQANLRVMVSGSNQKEHINAIRSALDAYSVPPYQELKAKTKIPVIHKLRSKLATNRLPSMFKKWSLVLSAAEVASLYHFPSSHVSKTDNLITSLSRTLPAPISLKQNKQLDVVIGRNEHHGSITTIGLTEAERERHVYIIGGTGNGKTTMLQYQIVQDMNNGKGIAVVDPHGDMAETLLRHVPEGRIKDVVYFNPDDITRPIGMNLLELPEGLTEDEEIREKDLVTEALISVFRKIFSEEDTGGHRIEYVLRNAIQTALTVKDATIFTIFDLLNDPTYRNKVVAKLDNKNLVNFWKHELGKAGDMQKVKMAAGITAKIGRFLFSASAKRILEQPKSTINFEDILDQGKILICNFSKGLIGEDTSELFGITVLAKLQLASLRRARIKQADRAPFYLYVDEFQNFATQSFVQMLSESRKYRLFLTMAEQSTSQQKDQQMVQIILANVGTVMCFRTGNPADEKLLLPLFSPYIQEGEISNQPPFNFYARFASTKSQEPLSGQTIVLEDDGSEDIASRVKEASRATYGNKPLQQEKQKKTTARPAMNSDEQKLATNDVDNR